MLNDPNRSLAWSLGAAIIAAAVVATFLAAQKADAAGVSVFITSYNPSKVQTDDSPCTGASGRDLCLAAREGDRTMAVSRDLLARNGGPFRWHDKVRVTSDVPQCNGVYSVEDTMARRYRHRADLFFLSRSSNTSCHATIERVTY